MPSIKHPQGLGDQKPAPALHPLPTADEIRDRRDRAFPRKGATGRPSGPSVETLRRGFHARLGRWMGQTDAEIWHALMGDDTSGLEILDTISESATRCLGGLPELRRTLERRTSGVPTSTPQTIARNPETGRQKTSRETADTGKRMLREWEAAVVRLERAEGLTPPDRPERGQQARVAAQAYARLIQAEQRYRKVVSTSKSGAPTVLRAAARRLNAEAAFDRATHAQAMLSPLYRAAMRIDVPPPGGAGQRVTVDDIVTREDDSVGRDAANLDWQADRLLVLATARAAATAKVATASPVVSRNVRDLSPADRKRYGLDRSRDSSPRA